MRRLLPLLLLVTACGPVPLQPHIYVLISPEFRPTQRDAVLQGLTAWHLAVPEISFEETSYLRDNTVTFRPSASRCDGAKAAGEYREDGDHRSICLYTGPSPCSIRRVTIHEVGHALRLPHFLPPSVMTSSCTDGEDNPTLGDIIAVREAWGFR